MKLRLLCLALFFAALVVLRPQSAQAEDPSASFYALQANLLEGQSQKFSDYRGKVVVITNIALQCGTTPQLKALQELSDEFSDQGLVILGFLSNDFTKENLDDQEAIRSFCTKHYAVSFPIFAPGIVTGANPQPVFAFLTQQAPENYKGIVEFNFEKFLLDRQGNIRARFGSFTSAQSTVFKNKIRELLKEGE